MSPSYADYTKGNYGYIFQNKTYSAHGKTAEKLEPKREQISKLKRNKRKNPRKREKKELVNRFA